MARPKPVANGMKLLLVVLFFVLLHVRESTRDEYVAAAPERSDASHSVEITIDSRTVYLTAEQSAWLDNLRTASWGVLLVGIVLTLLQDRRL